MLSRRASTRMRHVVFCGFFATVLIVIAACGSSSKAEQVGYQPFSDSTGGASLSWRLPYATGTQVWYTQGFHGDNWYLTGAGWQAEHVFHLNQQNDRTAIDLGPANPPKLDVPIYPLAKGKVIAINRNCHAVLIDHGYNIWTIYLHLNPSVSLDQVVNAGDSIGKTASPQNVDQCEYSSGPHVHLAFLHYDGTDTAHYVSMAGMNLCGQVVQADGAIGGLARPGQIFTVPDCGTVPPAATPTETPWPTPTPPAPSSSTCSTPWVQSPGDGATFGQGDSVDLYWGTDCASSYVEVLGGPYGTLNFGGWQGATSVHVGTMWPGTYSWHIKGRSGSGVETGWSASATFSVVGGPPPPTATPAPPATPAPTAIPQPTATSTPCPYVDNHGQFPTFYAQPNWQGQSVTFNLNPGQDLFFVFPSWLQQNLESFTDPYGAFHIVTFHTTSFGGNLAHWDTAQPGPLQNVDGYQLSASVEIYYHRTC